VSVIQEDTERHNETSPADTASNSFVNTSYLGWGGAGLIAMVVMAVIFGKNANSPK
jgi:hypothetical protein